MTLMTPTGVSQIIEQIAKAVSAVGLAYLLLGRGVEIAAGGATFGTTLGALFGTLYLAVRYYRARPEIREDIRLHQAVQRRHSPSSLLRTVVRYAVPITLGSAVLSMGNLVDLALVGARLQRAGFTQTETDALYGILNTQNARLVNLPTALSTALAAALLPGISAAVAERNAESLRYKTTEALKVSTLIAAPAAIGLSVLSHSVIAVLFPSHPDGGDVLAIGALSILFISLVQVLTAVLQGAGKMHLPPIFLLCGVLIKSVLNYHLVAIPELNIRGAGISSVVAYFAVVIADYLALTRTVRVAVPVREVFVRPVASAAIMGVVVCMARSGCALGCRTSQWRPPACFWESWSMACVIALRGITPGSSRGCPGIVSSETAGQAASGRPILQSAGEAARPAGRTEIGRCLLVPEAAPVAPEAGCYLRTAPCDADETRRE